MASGEPHMAIVGGGILGAFMAWRLARGGARVTVVEREAAGPGSATRWSFGWVGTGASRPSEDPAGFARELSALEEWRRVGAEPGLVSPVARGAIVWGARPEETGALIAEQRAAGARMEPLSREDLAKIEPGLAAPPALAALAVDDFAVEPATLARRLLAASGAALREGSAATAVETRGGRVTGLRMAAEWLEADIVVLANGTGAAELAGPLGIALPLRREPAVLLRMEGQAGLLRHVLNADGLELRPDAEGGLVSAADMPAEGEAGLGALRTAVAERVAGLLGPGTRVALRAVAVAERPMTVDGTPLNGPQAGVEGLWAVVAHPGVVLAPLLAREAAEALLRG